MQMLDLARLKRDMHALPGNVVAATKAQMDTLIDVAAEGQKAIEQLARLQAAGTATVAA